MLVAYDVATGRVIGRRKFGADGQPNALVNTALGEEGLLAITMANGIEVKDLYDAWKAAAPLTARGNPDAAGYAGLDGPDQLLIEAGRVVTLYAANQSPPNWRAWDLARPAADPTNPMPTGPTQQATPGVGGTPVSVALRLDGPHLFVCQPGAVLAFDLNAPSVHPVDEPNQIDGRSPQIRGVMVGTDNVIMIDDPVDRGPAPSPMVRVIVMSRVTLPGTGQVAGLWSFITKVPINAGVADWLGVDGGVYFLGGNHRLYFERGGEQR